MIAENLTTISTVMDIPVYAMVLLALVPTIATVVSFGRHVFGFNSFNIYVPIVTALVFLQIGLLEGLIISTLIFLITIYTRKLLINYRMHYYVRISFIYTIVCFAIFGFLVLLSLISAKTGIHLDKYLNFQPIFQIILLVTLVEEYFSTVVKEGENKVFVMFLETLAISVIGFVLISSTFFVKIIVNNIWILLLLFPLNIILARYEGLRFSELVRFKSVLFSEMRRIEENEDEKDKKKKKKNKNKKIVDSKTNSSGVSTGKFIW
ncbi:hypothetical protein COV24_03125 [candidate division WWE3 bacterium CG10_big_fil_rev_8_21_14_0_10_32_10]|uniref:7 transmembrane helices usually fused to an inactive transglutaminase domain-containing protein n=1 Tax=candidate division WWE3 bacterium CG10_big_fil_rev_8_21_14_0_10_32_10 TaxID=1975090 RepID=A0A2H0RA15_UNCKA|nr:MAG: hypothetical protein COV24_03125 [candidate division WWE3 bacterium CG10_big_fil_rev_8_21_14_0_10_32_10]